MKPQTRHLEEVEDREPISDSFLEQDAWRGIQQRRRAEALRAYREKSAPSCSPGEEWPSERGQDGFVLKIIAWLLREHSPVEASSVAEKERRTSRPLEDGQIASPRERHHEKRVPGFLSARCDGSEEGELGAFPLFETESPVGDARISPTHRQMRWKLGHIAKTAREARKRRSPLFRLDLGIVEFSITRQTKTAPSQSNVVEAIEELEEFVASQLEGEKEARYQKAVRARRW